MSQEYIPRPAFRRRLFANYYERTAQGATEKTYIEPLRKEIVAQAKGVVLEVGAGNGLNFAFYDPQLVECVEATEPDDTMLGYARERAEAASVPVVLSRTRVEHLPFADASFDCVVSTLVFCSVAHPLSGMQEIRRVLKPGGRLFMVEHVRSHKRSVAFIQDMLTPLSRLFLGNCHWNRYTEQTVQEAGFREVKVERRLVAGELLPIVLMIAES
ncbi:class I SAM-dependent methyltransferase [Ktedonospora formicarum]|uniref:Methyltransferase n=1 Tax=Ktedonospora formicarum TaxID=2778364 RepID=A0A8J3I5E8_9CHLR|nr:class I SAM-dependent methyltransferase [Ktedonospora formicarum]GHO46233.1 methyltransferase [Ktedonospora formicarum]